MGICQPGARRRPALSGTLLPVAAGLGRTIPALPVRDVHAAVAYLRERFGFDSPHETHDFAVVGRDDAVLHLWGALDDDWHSREDLAAKPIQSGAESFLAGTASCRIDVADVDALLASSCQSSGSRSARARSSSSATASTSCSTSSPPRFADAPLGVPTTPLRVTAGIE
jgi:hypothetical protein